MASTPYWIWMTIFKCDLKQYWRFLEVWEQALVAVKNRRFRNYHLHIYSLCSESRFLQCSLKELLADKLDTAERNPMAWIAFFMYLENKYLVFFDKSMSLVQQNYNELNILVWEIHLWSQKLLFLQIYMAASNTRYTTVTYVSLWTPSVSCFRSSALGLISPVLDSCLIHFK